MRRFIGGLAAVLAVAALGCTGSRHAFLRPASVPVPPSQEIEILDPAQSATGVPPVLLTGGADGTQKVDVPPAVLVHRYFPSGDRDFQAQFLPGGPTIITANHPKTMERTYVLATLPPGAPRVTYRHRTIVYDYGPQSVTVNYGHRGSPTVTYSQAARLTGRVERAVDTVKDHFERHRDSKLTGDTLRE